MKAWALLLVVPLAFAQPKPKPKAAPKAPMEHDHDSMHSIPDGPGPAADGSAWLRIDVTGQYLIHNANIVGQIDNPMYLVANRAYRVLPHPGPLIWTPPGGKMGPVPLHLLSPPIAVGSGK